MGTLLLELSLTRIFSVVFYYHFAFLAISIALFGMGAGGVFSYVVAGWKAPLFARLGRLSAINSFLVVFVLITILGQSAHPTVWDLALVYFATALPFFVSGTIVSLAISETIDRVDRVYFFDLAGAGGGCILLILLLKGFGGPSTVLAVAVIFAAAAAIWFSMAASVRGRVASVTLALFMVAFLTYNQHHHLIDVRNAKQHAITGELFQQWNPFSRIGMSRQPDGSHMIYIDADASTAIANFDFDHLSASDRRWLLGEGQSLPYILRPGAKTLIIGPGGGWDVSRALASGSHDITGVEINGIIADTIMRQRFPDLSRRLYLRPDVHIYVEDGRSFVRRSTDHFQVLQATLVDTWAATAAGAFALSENNLYTVDALRDYLEHLTPDGLVAFTRWGFDPPRESLRLVALAREALSQIGERQAWRNVIVCRAGSVTGWGALDTVAISRQPFTPADLDRARELFATAHLAPIYMPDGDVQNQFYALLHTDHPDDYERAYSFDITPVTDNRPFFFYTVQPRDLVHYLRTASRASADFRAVNEAVPLLFALMAISLVATLLILLLPPMVLGTRLPHEPGVPSFLTYFLFIGAGYILIEVGLIQKFVLFLGQPTYALAVVIFSMLVSSGIGSFLSRRLISHIESRLAKALGAIAILAAVLALTLGAALTALVWLPMPWKVVLTVLLIAPLGVAMGMPFPVGLDRLERWHSPSVRWAWSLNAASSVLGSVAALICSIYLGLVQTLIVGGLFYLAALAVVARIRPTVSADPEPGITRVVLAS
jgi:spermidine synthase